MKLRNKLTGEINIIKVNEDYFYIYKDDGEFVCPVTLKELNDGWEDYYEEHKEYWFINASGGVDSIALEDDYPEYVKGSIEIGNYFETKEEAEKAVERLRAWKRLKDKNFHFLKYSELGCGEIEFSLDFEDMDDEGEIGELKRDLDICFGGEE